MWLGCLVVDLLLIVCVCVLDLGCFDCFAVCLLVFGVTFGVACVLCFVVMLLGFTGVMGVMWFCYFGWLIFGGLWIWDLGFLSGLLS